MFLPKIIFESKSLGHPPISVVVSSVPTIASPLISDSRASRRPPLRLSWKAVAKQFDLRQRAAGKKDIVEFKMKDKNQCTSRESNPGQYRGRVL
jgi:hypothetical protein